VHFLTAKIALEHRSSCRAAAPQLLKKDFGLHMLLKNATIYNSDFEPQLSDIMLEGEQIVEIGENIKGEDVLDLTGCIILPGFIDIHIHGCDGADMADAKEDSLQTISRFLANHGVTSFCPATMTLPKEQLVAQFNAAAVFLGRESGAYMHGVNMEGPFIALSQKGAQPADYIRKPDIEEFNTLNAICKICLVDLAPETDGALEFAREASKTCVVSQAHTDADFETAEAGYQNGFSHATHLFSAMPPIWHRAPGAVVAAFDNKTSTAELICDGLHAHPPILRMAFKLLGENRSVVVSDAMRAAGCGDGEFELGGQKVYVTNGKATLASGNFAGSTTNMHREFLNLLSFNIPFKQALKSCTINPARVIGVDKLTGSLAEGKLADILVVDEFLRIKMVIVKGKMVYNHS
jgi:N-acetylglucosamine-6-phosphate deacetylase